MSSLVKARLSHWNHGRTAHAGLFHHWMTFPIDYKLQWPTLEQILWDLLWSFGYCIARDSLKILLGAFLPLFFNWFSCPKGSIIRWIIEALNLTISPIWKHCPFLKWRITSSRCSIVVRRLILECLPLKMPIEFSLSLAWTGRSSINCGTGSQNWTWMAAFTHFN